MFYRRDRLYTKFELALRLLLGSLLLALYFGVRRDEWLLFVSIWLGYFVAWVMVLRWLRSRGQIP